jgi:hypothetical protein
VRGTVCAHTLKAQGNRALEEILCHTKGSARNLGNLRAANRVRAGRQQR